MPPSMKPTTADMGNPPVHHPLARPEGQSRTPTPENGILAYVGAEYISAGSDPLPPASEKEQSQAERHVMLDVPGLGRVKITYELNTYRHRRSTFWHWRAKRADLVES